MKAFAYIATLPDDDFDLAAREADAKRTCAVLSEQSQFRAEWAGMITDEPPDSLEKFFLRPGGREILAKLKPDDTVLVWPDALAGEDAEWACELMSKAGATVRFMGTERTRDILRGLRRARHRWHSARVREGQRKASEWAFKGTGGRAKIGFDTRHYGRGRKTVVPSLWQAVLIKLIVCYRLDSKPQMGFGKISNRIELADAKFHRRDVLPMSATISRPIKRKWDRFRCRRAFEKWIRNDVPLTCYKSKTIPLLRQSNAISS
jgi:hypothetical protein